MACLLIALGMARCPGWTEEAASSASVTSPVFRRAEMHVKTIVTSRGR